MAARRSRGDGGLHYDSARQRWIASASLGYDPAGKRIVKRGSGRTKTEAKAKLRQVLRDHEDGLIIAPGSHTVAQAVTDWLAYGLNRRDPATVAACTTLCETHIIPALGACKLRDLRARDVGAWLEAKAETLSTATLQRLHSCLNRAINRAMARDLVRRKRRRPMLSTSGLPWPPVQVADPGSGRGDPDRGRGQPSARLHRGLAADRCSHRGATSP